MADKPSKTMFLESIREQARRLQAGVATPTRPEEWEIRRLMIRRELRNSWGRFPRSAVPLEAQILDRVSRPGYHLEKLLFQTWPGVTTAAHMYVPAGAGPFPAVLCVHGHWPLAKQEPRVQARCIGLAKLGFVALAVDAFGAGERGLAPALGEYHGAMVASTLWPSGRALAGVQVYENMRAVDYLQSREEVSADRIGITGTSGGGNQTMYAGAWDERFRCVVPVCSVGSYQAYLGAACCMCEVVPAALRYTEEWGILGLVAPRALMVINATRDAIQFSVGEARKTVEQASTVYKLFGHPGRIRHVPIDSGHDYNQPMREAMYGWMTRHLKEEGEGAPIAEPPLQTEDPEALRCWPAGNRSATFVTLPEFAARTSREITRNNLPPVDITHWETERLWRREAFQRAFRLSDHRVAAPDSAIPRGSGSHPLTVEAGVSVRLRVIAPSAPVAKRVVLLDLDQGIAAADSAFAKSCLQRKLEVVAVELRATGNTAPANDRIAQTADHNSAQWSLWIGRPLLVQWIDDVRAVLDALPKDDVETCLVGVGAAGLVALCGAVADDRVAAIALLESPLTLITEKPFADGRAGILLPGMLAKIGDVSQLVALCSPRQTLIAGGTTGAGEPIKPAELEALTAYPRQAFRLTKSARSLTLRAQYDAQESASWIAMSRKVRRK